MLASIAKPVFVTACVGNLAFSLLSGFVLLSATHHFFPTLPAVGGGVAFVVAAVAAFIILRGEDSLDRPWIKAALVFLVLGPLAFWGLQIPASAEVIRSSEAGAMHARAIGDVIQSQIAMIAVALAATFCATRAMAAMLDDLAV